MNTDVYLNLTETRFWSTLLYPAIIQGSPILSLSSLKPHWWDRDATISQKSVPAAIHSELFRNMAARSLATSLSITARDFASLLSSAKARHVGQFLEAPMIDNSIPMMADLYKSAGVSSLQGLEVSVKANFNEAQVCKKF